MKLYGKISACLGLVVAVCLVLGTEKVSAGMLLLPDAVVTVEGKLIKAKQAVTYPVVRELLVAFQRAETAVQKEDLQTVMAFYAPGYNYHGLKQVDVRRVWDEVFAHYSKLVSTHIFSALTIMQVDSQLRAEVICTGGLYGTEESTGKRITLDSWFQEVHYLVKEDGVWRFMGNAGDAPTNVPFSSAPHHPLF